jgi:acetyl-CoA C-acetyltransferase
MSEAFIVAAVRTPVGKRGGGLAHVHPVDLAAHVLRAVLDRAGVEAEHVDDVILGCVSQVGAQSYNIARHAVLSAGLPERVPGTTLDRQCGSSQQAVHFAAQAVQSGAQDLVIAGGVEVMSLIPLGAAVQTAGLGHPRGGQGWKDRYGDEEISQFRGADLIARNWNLSRAQLEDYALASHQRASAAAAGGLFDAETAAVDGLTRDEGPRPDASLAAMARLSPLREGGLTTAAHASQISDGAAALLVASARAVQRYGLVPLARVHTMTVVGSDPIMMLTGPIPATARLLERSGVALSEIGVFEVNEAFAPVVLAWLAETGADPARTNPLGGAIALGHPLGATGARLMTTMVHQLRRTGARYGLQTMCEGGGMANATLLERT